MQQLDTLPINDPTIDISIDVLVPADIQSSDDTAALLLSAAGVCLQSTTLHTTAHYR